ncbi:hypothetical protein REPUB_Repub01dG0212900 [Reevesia pubescens]
MKLNKAGLDFSSIKIIRNKLFLTTFTDLDTVTRLEESNWSALNFWVYKCLKWKPELIGDEVSKDVGVEVRLGQEFGLSQLVNRFENHDHDVFRVDPQLSDGSPILNKCSVQNLEASTSVPLPGFKNIQA